MSLWGELKRRNVVKVGVAYAIVAWLLVQVAVNLFPALLLPEWTVRFVAVLLLLGFPVASADTPRGLRFMPVFAT